MELNSATSVMKYAYVVRGVKRWNLSSVNASEACMYMVQDYIICGGA